MTKIAMAAMAADRNDSVGVVFDPGSFKDPEGRVCFVGDQVYRTLSASAAQRMSDLVATGLLDELIADGVLIPTRVTRATDVHLDPAIFGETLLHHERIPFVSYPFEWSFEMLREAALATIALIERCLDRDLILKDATAYNVTLYQGRMVFFDTLSIDRYAPGAPWEAYGQFCREFLFPLMFTAYKGVEFQAWFRGDLDGLSVADMARMMVPWNILRRGVLRHVALQWRLEKSFADKDVGIRSSFDQAPFSKDIIRANLRNIRRLIEGLCYRPVNSEWIDYVEESSYSDHDSEAKRAFVARAMERIAPGRVADLGCNTGLYSRIAAEHARLVVAVDIDPACVNSLYGRVRDDGLTNVQPVVGNLLNPTPAMGWNLRQRRSLFERLQSDAVLALALVHHICIGGNVPLASCLDQMHAIAPAGVIEWIGKDDAMVQKMLRNRDDVFVDYDWEHFERLVRERYTLAEVAESHGGARRLCLLLPKPG